MHWIAWIRGSLSAALQWFEAHAGTAAWLEALGSIGAIIFVYLFALLQNRRFRAHENIDRIRKAQGPPLVPIPGLTAFRPKNKAAIIHSGKPAPPGGIIHRLDQLYITGI